MKVAVCGCKGGMETWGFGLEGGGPYVLQHCFFSPSMWFVAPLVQWSMGHMSLSRAACCWTILCFPKPQHRVEDAMESEVHNKASAASAGVR